MAPDSAVSLVPVATPAGGLTRVVAAESGEVLLDCSYAGGTAACSLVDKMKWKIGDPEKRGPPPFKGTPPRPPWPEKIAALLVALEAGGFGATAAATAIPDFDAAKAARDQELKARGSDGKEAWLASLRDALDEHALAGAAAIVASDTEAVALAEAEARAALGL